MSGDEGKENKNNLDKLTKILNIKTRQHYISNMHFKYFIEGKRQTAHKKLRINVLWIIFIGGHPKQIHRSENRNQDKTLKTS